MSINGGIAVIGYSENVKIFKSLGLLSWQVATLDEAREKLKKISEMGNFRLVFVLGRLGQDLKNEIDSLNAADDFNVLLLPDSSEGFGAGGAVVEEKVKKAIGFKISW